MTTHTKTIALGVDLDAEVPCSPMNEMCGAPAQWRFTLQCRHSILYCESHHAHMVDRAASIAYWNCSWCHVETPVRAARWYRI